MRFDFLHSPRPLAVQRILQLRVPERFQRAALAVCFSLAVVGGAWIIEACRLREALRIEAEYQRRYDLSAAAVRRADVYYARVRALAELDKQVRSIAFSGDLDARTLAEIADVLPAHAWLTGIAHDPTGLSLAGEAKDLAVVGGVMRSLMHARHLRAPSLVSAALVKDDARSAVMNYQIHVERSAP